MIRFGPDGGPIVVMILPLLEEHNRTRTFAVTVLRRLADLGVASVLPDLPGMGESMVPIADATIDAMRRAVAALVGAIGERCFAAAIRSGALIDPGADFAGRWHFAPQPGPALLRELARMKQAEAGLQAPLADDWQLAPSGCEIAGNLLMPPLLGELATAQPCVSAERDPLRVVRLESDLAAADLKLPGLPLWRQSEPGNDPDMATALAADIAHWVHRCAA